MKTACVRLFGWHLAAEMRLDFLSHTKKEASASQIARFCSSHNKEHRVKIVAPVKTLQMRRTNTAYASTSFNRSDMILHVRCKLPGKKCWAFGCVFFGVCFVFVSVWFLLWIHVSRSAQWWMLCWFSISSSEMHLVKAAKNADNHRNVYKQTITYWQLAKTKD